MSWTGEPGIMLLSRLVVDAMYLDAAQRALERVREKWQPIEDLHLHIESVLSLYDRAGDAEQDRIFDELLDLASDREDAYERLVGDLATVHVLSAAAAEAHINWRAAQRLERRDNDAFNALTLEGKWLLFARFACQSTFDAGKDPFQSFSQLLRYRNALVHHKPLEEFDHPARYVPKTIRRLGLTLGAAERSLNSVQKMILTLHEMLGEEDESPAFRPGQLLAMRLAPRSEGPR